MQIFSLCRSFILLFSLMVNLKQDPSQQQSSFRANAQSLEGSALKGSLRVWEQSALGAAGGPLGILGGQKGHPAGPASLCPVLLNRDTQCVASWALPTVTAHPKVAGGSGLRLERAGQRAVAQNEYRILCYQ